MSDACPAATLAKLFNLHERRVRQLGQEGIIPRPQHGQYDLLGSVQGYVKYLQARAEGRHLEGQDVHAERGRLVRAKAHKAELEIAALEGSLLPFDEVVAAWQQLVAAFRARCLALPSKLAPVVSTSEISEIQDHIDRGIREALEELSRFKLAGAGPSRNRRSGQRRKAPAEAHPKRVGRPARRTIG